MPRRSRRVLSIEGCAITAAPKQARRLVTSLVSALWVGFSGLTKHCRLRGRGISSCSTPNRFAPYSVVVHTRDVAAGAGKARDKASSIGSGTGKTIGMVVVAILATRVGAMCPGRDDHSHLARTKSAARAGSRSILAVCPPVLDGSRFWPST